MPHDELTLRSHALGVTSVRTEVDDVIRRSVWPDMRALHDRGLMRRELRVLRVSCQLGREVHEVEVHHVVRDHEVVLVLVVQAPVFWLVDAIQCVPRTNQADLTSAIE